MAVRDGRENWLSRRDGCVEGAGKTAAFSFELSELAEHHDIAIGDLLQKLSAGGIDAVRIEVARSFGSRCSDVDREHLAGNDVAQISGSADAVRQSVASRR